MGRGGAYCLTAVSHLRAIFDFEERSDPPPTVYLQYAGCNSMVLHITELLV